MNADAAAQKVRFRRAPWRSPFGGAFLKTKVFQFSLSYLRFQLRGDG
jgi:hypothetical protein